MTKDEALDLALEFFETMQRYKGVRSKIFIKFEPTATGDYVDLREFDEKAKPIITAIKQARSAPVQEPVAWRTFDGEGGYDYRTYDMNEGYAKEWNERNPNHKGWVEPLYTTPPTAQRQWVGLTDAEVMQTMSGDWTSQFYFARAIEAKLKKENT